MDEKELRRMGKSEILNLILSLENERDSYRNEAKSAKLENIALRHELENKKMMLEDAGNIAEASIRITGVFMKAQETADLYLAEVQRYREEKMKEADEMLRRTEAECAKKLAETDRQTEAKWQDFREKADALVKNNRELFAMINRKNAAEDQ